MLYCSSEKLISGHFRLLHLLAQRGSSISEQQFIIPVIDLQRKKLNIKGSQCRSPFVTSEAKRKLLYFSFNKLLIADTSALLQVFNARHVIILFKLGFNFREKSCCIHSYSLALFILIRKGMTQIHMSISVYFSEDMLEATTKLPDGTSNCFPFLPQFKSL